MSKKNSIEFKSMLFPLWKIDYIATFQWIIVIKHTIVTYTQFFYFRTKKMSFVNVLVYIERRKYFIYSNFSMNVDEHLFSFGEIRTTLHKISIFFPERISGNTMLYPYKAKCCLLFPWTDNLFFVMTEKILSLKSSELL